MPQKKGTTIEEATRPQTKQEKIAAVRSAALNKATAFKRCFTSPDGKIVLKELQLVFMRQPLHIPGDSHATHVRVGELKVLQHIQEILELDTDAT